MPAATVLRALAGMAYEEVPVAGVKRLALPLSVRSQHTPLRPSARLSITS
jgi:hypothetical protein